MNFEDSINPPFMYSSTDPTKYMTRLCYNLMSLPEFTVQEGTTESLAYLFSILLLFLKD